MAQSASGSPCTRPYFDIVSPVCLGDPLIMIFHAWGFIFGAVCLWGGAEHEYLIGDSIVHSHHLGLCTGGLGHVCGMYKAASTKILRILIPAIYKEAAMTLNIVRGPHSYLDWPQQHVLVRQPWPWPCIVLRGRFGLTTITTVQGS